jgi:hypothetical protein
VTYSSDVCICFSDILEELLAGVDMKDLVELRNLDLSILNLDGPPTEPLKQAIARGKKKSFSDSISTGKSFWPFSKSISHFRKTCISMHA